MFIFVVFLVNISIVLSFFFHGGLKLKHFGQFSMSQKLKIGKLFFHRFQNIMDLFEQNLNLADRVCMSFCILAEHYRQRYARKVHFTLKLNKQITYIHTS